MRTLNRNKQTIYYSLYNGNTEIVDEYGLDTGEFESAYSTPTPVKVNVSAAKGNAHEQLFGIDVNYSKTLVSHKDLGFDEHTILWVDKDATVGSVVTPYNYRVVAVAKSLNSVTYAIRGVDVSCDDND